MMIDFGIFVICLLASGGAAAALLYAIEVFHQIDYRQD